MSVTSAPTYEFTVEEYHKLGGVLFDEDDRVELLNGNIIVMSPIGVRHGWAVREIINLFVTLFGRECLVDAQNPVVIDGKSEPQPDVLLVKKSIRTSGRHAHPEDVLLLVEVADSTLTFDRTDKRAAYARNGISEFWLLDLVRNELLVHRESDGREYRSVQVFGAKDSVAPLAFPGTSITVSEILPP
jgi:Uma2 family endonuclease